MDAVLAMRDSVMAHPLVIAMALRGHKLWARNCGDILWFEAKNESGDEIARWERAVHEDHNHTDCRYMHRIVDIFDPQVLENILTCLDEKQEEPKEH